MQVNAFLVHWCVEWVLNIFFWIVCVGKLVSISSNGLGHQLCALEYQEASQK
jgi:hypothetical protein